MCFLYHNDIIMNIHTHTTIKKQKHQYLFKLFWSFAFIKTIILLVWLVSIAYVYNTTFAANPDDGFIISEYLEWSSYNKAIELYNGSNSDIDLSQYKLNLYANGIASPYKSLTLNGTLNQWDTYIVAHPNSDSTIIDIANITNNIVINFNGDDAISLSRLNASHVDVFWQIGFRPSTSWSSNGVSTADQTLVRKANVIKWDNNGLDLFDPSIERMWFPKDTFDYLWTHIMNTDTIKPIATIDFIHWQISPTLSLTGKFLVTFSEPINLDTFTCDDIDLTLWTAPWQTCISIREIAPDNYTTFEVTIVAENDWTIVIDIPNGVLSDLNGNTNDTTILTNNSITIDRSSLRMSPWDIIIVTTNANPDFFEFLANKEIGAWTVLYFTDNSRNENKTWRTWEWTIVFTATHTIARGTIISIQWAQTSSPSLIQNGLGTVTRTGTFDLAVNGDNILVYQWNTYDTSYPMFIHGFWFWPNPRVRTNSANNSFLPEALTLWINAINYSIGHRNTQYSCYNTAMLSDTFISDIHNPTYRNGNNTTNWNYSPISCVFDATKPEVSIDLADGQNNPTSWSMIKFLATFSEAINTWSFDCSDVHINGTAEGKTCVGITEITPNNWTRFEITTSVSGNWFILINIEPNKITDIAGNPNNSAAIIYNNVVVNITPPYLSEITPISTPSSNITPSYTFHSNEGWNISYSWFCSSTTTRANPWNNTIVLDTLEEWTYTDCTITVIDDLWNISDPLSISAFTIDLSIPLVIETIRIPNITNLTTPEYTFTTDEEWGTIVYGGDCSSSIVTSIAWNNTITFDTLSEWEHNNCVISIIDWAGNIGTLNVSSFTIDTIAPSVYEVTPIITPSTNQTPEYVFSSNESWIISYGWTCSSETNTAIVWHNYIVMDILNIWTYDNCTITITDNAWNISNDLLITEFTIEKSSEVTEIENNKGWWTSTTLFKDDCPHGDLSPSYYDGTCEAVFNEEIIDTPVHGSAPIFNYEKKINRKTLAKFIVFFATEVMHIKPNIEKSCIFHDTKNETQDDQSIIQQACQLNIMWVQQNGITSAEEFRPKALVTRNEFITTISRLLFNEKNNITLSSSLDFYNKHILALENINLLQDIPEKITQHTILNIFKIIYKNPNFVTKK